MIISKEIRQNAQSPVGKELCVSYVTPDGGIGYFQHIFTEQDWFEWKHTTRAQACQPEYVIDSNTGQYVYDENGQPVMKQWKSYDNKFIRREALKPNSRSISGFRQNEILNSYGNRIDHVFEMNIPNMCFVDIETLVTETSGFPDAETAAQPITTISLTKFPNTIIWGWKELSQEDLDWIQNQIDTYSENQATEAHMKNITKGYKFEYRYFPDERSMMIDFINYINSFTAICGWNFLQYDWKYIHNRCTQYLGIDMTVLSPTGKCENFSLQPRVGGHKISLQLPLHKIIFDYMLIIQNWDTTIKHPENYKLDYIAERVLSVKKVKHEWGFAEFYKNHYKEYVFYNCIDTVLIEQIDKAINTAAVWFMLSSILRIDLNAAYSTITPVETVMSNYIYPDFKIIPGDKPKVPDVQENYEGAFVWPTRPMVGKLIAGKDFASLYPSIMRQFGISPEVFVEKNPDRQPKADEIKTASGAIYRKDKNAIIPSILTHYFALRKEAKKDKKIAEAELEYFKKIHTRRLESVK